MCGDSYFDGLDLQMIKLLTTFNIENKKKN